MDGQALVRRVPQHQEHGHQREHYLDATKHGNRRAQRVSHSEGGRR